MDSSRKCKRKVREVTNPNPTATESVVEVAAKTSTTREDLGITATVEEEVSGEQRHKHGDSAGASILPPPYFTTCLQNIINNNNEDEDESNNNNETSLIKLAKHVFHKLSKKQKNAKMSWNPTPIQLQSWPILQQTNNLNLIAIAPTGSGKTFGYVIPMVHSCMNMIISQKQLQHQHRHRRKKTKPCRRVHGLVLLPTRELAIQVSKVLKIVTKTGNQLLANANGKKDEIDQIISAMVIYGGVDREEQIDSLSQQKEFIVAATPMRLIDLLGIGEGMEGNRTVQALFVTTSYLVIDEADTMATKSDMAEQVDLILKFLRDRQSNNNCFGGNRTLKQSLFSATLPRRAVQKCDGWIDLPRAMVKVDTVTVGQEQTLHHSTDGEIKNGNGDGNGNAAKEKTGKDAAACRGPLDLSIIPAHITQLCCVCSNNEKPKKLMEIINKIRNNEKKQCSRRKGLIIIFFAKIKTLQSRHSSLQKEKVNCVPFHGQMNQKKREQQLNDFKCGKSPILLATDIAARGIHCNNVEYVINYDFPESIEQVSCQLLLTIEE